MTPQQYQAALKALSAGSNTVGDWTNNPSFSGVGNAAGTGASALGIYNDVQRGGVTGDVGAAANAAKLASKYGSNLGLSSSQISGLNTGATGALDALNIYQGIQQGGVTGYGRATGSALQGAGLLTGNPALTTAGGYVLAPLAVYNAVKNWQSGRTGSDAVQGAEAGAAVGSIIPGIGTIIGGALGALAGAASSAFGGGAHDPETDTLYNYLNAYNKTPGGQQGQLASSLTPGQNFQMLAGVMDAKNNSPGHSTPLEQVFGRMGENNLLNQMTQQINQAQSSGAFHTNPDGSVTFTPKGQGTVTYSAKDAPSQLYSQVVDPWLQSKGAGIDPNSSLYTTVKGQKFGPELVNNLQNLIGQWKSGQITNSTPIGISGEKDTGLQGYGGALTTLAQPTMNTMPVAAGGVRTSAEGGSMSALDSLKRKKRKHFDDGGDVGDDYSWLTAPDSTQSWETDPTVMGGSNFSGLPQVTGGGSGNVPWYNDPTVMGSNASPVNPGAGGSPSSPSASSSSGHTISGDLQNLMHNLSGQNGITGLLNVLKGSAPLLAAALGHSNTNTKAPSPFPGMTQGASAPGAPLFNRSQVANPSNLPSGAPMTQQDWYTYGSRPEAQFFKNNFVPLAQATGVSHKKGGALSQLKGEEEGAGMPQFDSGIESYAEGPGDGTSDDIPAKLSDGEYVMDANTVSLLGNGSNKAGAQRLDQLRENLRKHAAKPMVKGKQFMKAKPPAAYMKGEKK